MKVKCININCLDFDKVVEVADWDGLHSYGLYILKQCPTCKKLRKYIPEVIENKEEQKETGFNVAFAKIGSMTPQERKKVLKKRSNEHFNKHLKERKEYLDRAIIGKE